MHDAATLDPGFASARGLRIPEYAVPSSSLKDAITEPWRKLKVKILAEEYPELPDWVNPVINQIRELVVLRPNWDSYGAIPIWSIQEALRVLATVMDDETEIPWIVPLPSGGVQLEWERPPGGIEIVIDLSGSSASIGETESALDQDALAAIRGHLNS